ncbi:MAG: hypothetical protein GY788_20970 [bacterium]|nr:hypothetical protein [bacterium]
MLVHAVVEGDPSKYRLDGDDELYKESWVLVHEERIYDDTDDVRDVYPDLDDPATRGCLVGLVRRAHPGIVWLSPCDEGGWCLMHCYTDPHVNGCEISVEDTEAEALVAALECAP